MILYIATGVAFLLLLLSIWRDSRSLLNPALLIISLLFALVSVIQLSYLSGNSNSYMLALMVCFLGIPFLIFLSGIFLVYNGIVLLKREGNSDLCLFWSDTDSGIWKQSVFLSESLDQHFFYLLCLFLFDLWLCICRFYALFHFVPADSKAKAL